MSRNFFPVVMAIGVGVFTGNYLLLSLPASIVLRPLVLTSNFSVGYYTFQPTFQQMAIEKEQTPQQSQSTGLSHKENNAPSNPAADNSKPETQGSK
ncbi:uncharacterized protein N7496_002986 [Penicillium cataractarum]|uniref:Uncharacterized protein n=1 Tax=Penicillium cataractarum TaxID=2100454 RepID=A0A9W9VFR3_9EURO|nr:uncharacterized protein N7496_002986 [Penicillium cataractarum]KAJ5380558.1 hypothetical protein N7496_002986 [Penicillium cataractarum]